MLEDISAHVRFDKGLDFSNGKSLRALEPISERVK